MPWRQLTLPCSRSPASRTWSILGERGHGHEELADLETLLSHSHETEHDEALWLRLSTLLAVLPLKTVLVIPESLEDACSRAAAQARAADTEEVRDDAMENWARAVSRTLDGAQLEIGERDSSLCAHATSLPERSRAQFLSHSFGVPRVDSSFDAFDGNAAAERLGRAVAEARLPVLPCLVRRCLQFAGDSRSMFFELGDQAFAVLHGWAQARGERPSADRTALTHDPGLLSLLKDLFGAVIPRARDLAAFELDGWAMGRLLVELQLSAEEAGVLFSELAQYEASRPSRARDSNCSEYCYGLASVQAESRTPVEVAGAVVECLIDDGSQAGVPAEMAAPFYYTACLLREWAASNEKDVRANYVGLLGLGESQDLGDVDLDEPTNMGADDQVPIEALVRAARTVWRGTVLQRLSAHTATALMQGICLQRLQHARSAAQPERESWTEAEAERRQALLGSTDDSYAFRAVACEAREAARKKPFAVEVTDATRLGELLGELHLDAEQVAQIGSVITRGADCPVADCHPYDPFSTPDYILGERVSDAYQFAGAILRAWAMTTKIVSSVSNHIRASTPAAPAAAPPSLLCCATSAVLASAAGCPTLPFDLHLPPSEVSLCLDALVRGAEASWRREARERHELMWQKRRKREEAKEAQRKARRLYHLSLGGDVCGCGRAFGSPKSLAMHLRDSKTCKVAVEGRRAAQRVETMCERLS